ncbi:MAG: RnfH family protein [Gammaproteobacteria bacterium]|nr:RnfH family protein [Gammaproteobacteria bacterium]
MTEPLINVDVAYALPEKQQVEHLQLHIGVTARDALKQSKLPQTFSEIDIAHCALGIFGKQVKDDYVLKSGDRLEIYRPLINDPRETRRRLAAEGKTMGSARNYSSN